MTKKTTHPNLGDHYDLELELICGACAAGEHEGCVRGRLPQLPCDCDGCRWGVACACGAEFLGDDRRPELALHQLLTHRQVAQELVEELDLRERLRFCELTQASEAPAWLKLTAGVAHTVLQAQAAHTVELPPDHFWQVPATAHRN